jgi:hypothetical protein
VFLAGIVLAVGDDLAGAAWTAENSGPHFSRNPRNMPIFLRFLLDKPDQRK